MNISAPAYEKYKKALWNLTYRITGNAADSDDIVQETFLRFLQKPPEGSEGELKPWLMRVATNLSIDKLRQRKRRQEFQAWLPSPIPDDDVEPVDLNLHANNPSARYDFEETLSFAFLLAMEALSPSQRVVLVLRDILDLSVQETAKVLNISQINVKVTLHRARKIMQTYDKTRTKDRKDGLARMRKALESFLTLLERRDAAGLQNLLTQDVQLIADGNREVVALKAPMHGRENVMRLLVRLNEVYSTSTTATFLSLNGEPAVLFERKNVREGHAKRFTLHCQLSESGMIERLNFVFAPGKLALLPGTSSLP
jgi:RNA polymerase sigma-70 factor (ECF subfamily)